MPPLFVDGVEIASVFVDGVEQASVFADGVEVFTSGEAFFDDFERSPIGTNIEDHLMNTGQSWIYDRGNGFFVPTIQDYVSGRAAFMVVEGIVPPVAFRIQPIPEAGPGTLSLAMVIRVAGDWSATLSSPETGSIQATLRDVDEVERRTVEFIYRIGGASILSIYTATETEAITHEQVPIPGDPITGAEVELFTDGIDFQGRCTVDSVVYTTGKYSLMTMQNQIPNHIWVQCGTNFFGNTGKECGIHEFELTPYSPSSVPFP